jgi:type III restriction enzyme
MARTRSEIETPPPNWTPTQAVDDPIINNPYQEPKEYWLYDHGVPGRIPGRRPASYWYKTRRTGAAAQAELFSEESSDDLPLVNALRRDIRKWRESGYRGASSVTRELFRWWQDENRPRRLFFCQLEAVETLVYLLEIALPGRLQSTGFRRFAVEDGSIQKLLKGEKPDFQNLADDFYPRLIDPPFDSELLPLRRLGCKMATGSGKTIIMAMLITWAFANRGRNPATSNFPEAVLICAPNLTVKQRLDVLKPDNPDNYFDSFDLVPPKYREFLNRGKILITNWHKLALKSEHIESGKSYAVVNKGEETNDAFTLDRLGELAKRLPLLVFNDEGHHCWRGKPLSKTEENQALKGKDVDEKKALRKKRTKRESGWPVWIASTIPDFAVLMRGATKTLVL